MADRSSVSPVIEGRLGIWFDAVGTLISPDPPALTLYAQVGRRYGSRLSPEEIEAGFRRAYQAEERRDLAAGWRTSEEREQERWRRIVAGALPDVADFEQCFQELFEHFAGLGAWRPAPGAGTVLEELARQGIRLGLASNYDSRLHSVLAGLPELRPLEHIAISSEVGWRKPAGKFFDHIVETFAMPREQLLFVGDDISNDWQGARDAGLQAVLFDPRGRRPEAKPRIVALRELL